MILGLKKISNWTPPLQLDTEDGSIGNRQNEFKTKVFLLKWFWIKKGFTIKMQTWFLFRSGRSQT